MAEADLLTSGGSERVIQLIQKLGLTNQEFCRRTGLSMASITHLATGRSNPTLSLYEKILSAFPSVSSAWLVLGQGELSTDGSLAEVASLDFGPQEEPTQAVQPVGQETAVRTRPSQPADLFTGFDMETLQRAAAAKPASSLSQQDAQLLVRTTLREEQALRRRVVEVRIFFDDGTYESFSQH